MLDLLAKKRQKVMAKAIARAISFGDIWKDAHQNCKAAAQNIHSFPEMTFESGESGYRRHDDLAGFLPRWKSV